MGFVKTCATIILTLLLFTSCTCDSKDFRERPLKLTIFHKTIYPSIDINKAFQNKFYKIIVKYSSKDSNLYYPKDIRDSILVGYVSHVGGLNKSTIIKVVSDSLSFKTEFTSFIVTGGRESLGCSDYKISKITAKNKDSILNITDGITIK